MRTKNSIRNIIVALAGQLIGILLSFVSRKVFIRVMSSTLLGVNSVFFESFICSFFSRIRNRNGYNI